MDRIRVFSHNPKTSFVDYKWPILTLVPHTVGFPIIGMLSLQGKLGSGTELVFGATALVAAITWVSTFYAMWKGLLDRAKMAAE